MLLLVQGVQNQNVYLYISINSSPIYKILFDNCRSWPQLTFNIYIKFIRLVFMFHKVHKIQKNQRNDFTNISCHHSISVVVVTVKLCRNLLHTVMQVPTKFHVHTSYIHWDIECSLDILVSFEFVELAFIQRDHFTKYVHETYIEMCVSESATKWAKKRVCSLNIEQAMTWYVKCLFCKTSCVQDNLIECNIMNRIINN